MLCIHRPPAGLDLPKWAPCFSKGQFPELPEDGMDPLGLDPDRQVGKPVVMAVQGICLTIGLELLLACDIRIAADTARFGQIEIKRGIYPAGGATVRLFQEVGWGNAMRYLLTGDEITAKDAFRLGLVQEVTSPDACLDTAIKIAQTISKQAPLGVAASLQSSRLARFLVVSYTSDWLYPTYQSREMVTAMKKNNLDVSFCEIEAQWGHDAFLLPNEKLDHLMKGFLNRVAHESAPV